MAPRFFDTHAHLDGPKFSEDLDDTLARARAAGITDIVCIGASEGFESNPRALALADAHAHLHATVGIHPHDAEIVDDALMDRLMPLARHPKVVAIGETGLDYYYDHSDRDAQQAAFRRFIRLAKALDRPLVIHSRDAEADTLRILEEEDASTVGGIIHCFTGTDVLADGALDLGFYISFSGVLTFKNAQGIRDIARRIPRERALVETDCPYLAPVPRRGKRNEPAFVAHTTEVLAGLWDASPADTMKITGHNAERIFRLG